MNPELAPAANANLEGTRIDRYKILQRIGEGGFGLVYMAEQVESVQRRVALKIIKAGMDTKQVIARFEAERRALAMIDHPNIARFLDVGETAEGSPYFVMELVKGMPITRYCHEKKLPAEARIGLFLQVCRAVQHAHVKGIIHRDLKPSNILITLQDGHAIPKVIDFGIAKAMDQQLTDKTLFTRFEHMLGTPAYMSPEQVALSAVDVDTRSDVYALGVLLYELLTGTAPFDAETLRKAAAEEIRRMLADPRSDDFVSNFTNQWLSLPKMKTVPINQDLFPRFLYYVEAGERKGTEKPYIPTIRDHMIDESVAFIAELIRRNASITNLVDSDFAMLNQPLAAHYGVSGVEGHRIRPVPIKPEHHLGGLLTHGSMLIGNATGSAPHPIYRAVWLREAILGDEVKPPPAEVPALTDSAGDSAEQALSIKDLLAKHRTKESCNDCHVRLDPWGIPFERYNAIGKDQHFVPKTGTRVRGFNKQTDSDLTGYLKYLTSVNTREVQADSRVPHGPDVDGLPQLKAHLLKTRKHDIAENVIRRLLTYATGRKLDYRDRYELETILSQSKQDGFLLRDTIVRVCQSATFRSATNHQK